jgi:2-polyprenyl-6-hydroxyphenyl methylase/3-demethylubiquinone-9 3-methyltransferase
MVTMPNADRAELAKFDRLAQSWWDPRGSSRPLHELNPLRLQYIERVGALSGKRVLDTGCGGILAESMARAGARVLGIDLSHAVIEVAELHALADKVPVQYRVVAAEVLAAEEPHSFDLVTCMELLEHVPDPGSTLAALAALARPDGDVIVSTLNRNAQAFLTAIVGAEYIAGMLPRGTHEYLKFIRPSELAQLGRAAGLELKDLTGVVYNPLTRAYRLSTNTRVNYLAHFRRESRSQ